MTTTPIPLEDTYIDMIGKAMRGLGLTEAEVAGSAGIEAAAVAAVQRGKMDQAVLRAIAPVLGFDAGALVEMAAEAWQPQAVAVPGLACFNTRDQDMRVNSYIAFDRESGEAAAFDTGADCGPMLDFLSVNKLVLRQILLTHTHPDHVHDLERLRAGTGAPVFVGEREAFTGAEGFRVGRVFRCGVLRITTRLTWGHSRGGISYVIEGLEAPVAVVGDAVFAGSMGGGAVSYCDALATNRSQIFSLPEATVLCPGHGPLTTVGEELKHNPFFANRVGFTK